MSQIQIFVVFEDLKIRQISVFGISYRSMNGRCIGIGRKKAISSTSTHLALGALLVGDPWSIS